MPLDESNPNEKQRNDKNDQTPKLSVIEPEVLRNQEHPQYPQHPQQKRESPSGGEHSIPEKDQPTKHKKREAIDEPSKKDEQNGRKSRDTTNQKSEPTSNQKQPSERKTRDIKQTDPKPEVPTSGQTKYAVRSVRDTSGKDLDTSKTGNEPPKPFTRQRRQAPKDQKPDENVKHIDEDKDHPSKSTVKRSANKFDDNVPKPIPANGTKN